MCLMSEVDCNDMVHQGLALIHYYGGYQVK